MRNLLNKGFIFISALLCLYLFTGASSESGNKQSKSSFHKTNEGGEFFVFDINNLYMPLDNKGVIADVDPGAGYQGPYGQFGGGTFLYSAGFYMSGINDGKVWSNGVLSASRIEDYQPGPVGASQYDPKNKVYVVSQRDDDFGDSWQEWIDAVSIGADFYDGDGDGVYNPIDKNGNGKWDTNEDKPDILGDKTAWCVYNDGVPSALRRYTTIKPAGIEIHQTVFGFESAGIVGNLMFVRYRIVNTGSVYDKLEDVYFSAAADPDLGTPDDDLVGCDIDLSAGFVYNNGPDSDYGTSGDRPPSFLIDFFLGPVVFEPGVTFQDNDGNGSYDEGIDVPLDSAFVVRGQLLGKDTIPGGRNLPLSSMTQYMQSHPTHGDPDNQFEVRNYLIGGRGKEGDSVYVSTWTFGNGSDLGADTANIEARFMYSGEPEAGTGWLNIEPIDQRIMCNTGPFEIKSGEYQDIFVAYVVGQGENAFNSVTVAKENDITAQLIFDNNFPTVPPPPPVDYTISQGDGFIDIIFNTSENLNYRGVDTVFLVDRRVEGFYLNTFKYPTTSETVGGQTNKITLLSNNLDNWIQNIYVENKEGNKFLLRDTGTTFLDPNVYADSSKGRFKYRISEDPFTREPLTYGQDYYFGLGQYTLNYNAIVNKETGAFGDVGDVIYSEIDNAYEEWNEKMITVRYGSNDYNPELGEISAELTSGSSDGEVKFLIVDSDSLTGNDYQVQFFRDSSNKYYDMFWRLVNTTTGVTLIDSSKNYDYDLNDISGDLIDGFKVKVKEAAPQLIDLTAQQEKFESADKWYTDFNRNENTGIYYVGKDIKPSDDANFDPIYNPLFKSADARGISVGQIKRIELRFGETSKAYRYLNGFYGSNPLRQTKSYVYAEAITDQDTIDHGPVGNWDTANNHAVGRVDVPFAAYVVDYKLGTADEPFEQRLNVAIIEKSSKESSIYPKPGNPDGIWDPGTSIAQSEELIAILNSEYSESDDPIYVGGFVDSEGETVWADLIQGYDIPENITVTNEERNIGKYPFFDALYTVNLQRLVDKNEPNASFYTAGDKLVMEVASYPYTESDVYSYTSSAGGEISEEVRIANFEKVNVFPNPLYGYNSKTSLSNTVTPDDPFVTFSHLPDDVTIRIYSLSGSLLRTLSIREDGSASSSTMNWDLKNESGLRVASGMYLAIVESPKYGQKILKFAVILPQKQLKRY